LLYDTLLAEEYRQPPMQDLDEETLADMRLFRKLDRDQVRRILEQSITRRHPIRTPIFHEGDPAERFFLLVNGMVRVVRSTPGGTHIVPLHISPGHLFGIAPAFGGDSYPATAVAAADSLTLSWPAALWQDFLHHYKGFAEEIWRDVGERIKELHMRVSELTTQSAEQRIASALLRLARQSGRHVGDRIEIAFPVTRSDIAEMTGTNLHTVSRLLSAWERAGIVRSGRMRIAVTDVDRLELLRT
jgi:CRP/FNR family transcriptional regulator, nitrogen oxide reductase regulator